ncbi:glutathione S-transferase [Pseudomonas sp. HMWF032]|uniref:glutathione S-transferase family protein n=1 Tax=Pseudomonas sp. HMWF032 TaxID=2056866 RepID=UPI000D3ACB28|nr:glutathione S-transferase family protein [Pseudomonas sp. HMWF032]PTS85456.1 glutathione S-transferase [Pseudomonas sp. HMWF032]PTT85803.1 glutathione S-transferase [Pseudomonas sp. HMWF010]
MSFTLVIGDKTYSSWSLRAALALELTGAAYTEQLITLNRPDTRARILQHSPTGKVPLLICEDGPIWDSLAIAEYLAECFPAAQLWPQARAARALARSACSEMHSGFAALRSHLPMDLKRNQALTEIPADAVADIQRICVLWAECRQRFAQEGGFLFGQPTLADAFFAPVAARLRSYQVALPAEAAAYVDTIYQWPAFQRWYQAAQEEHLA